MKDIEVDRTLNHQEKHDFTQLHNTMLLLHFKKKKRSCSNKLFVCLPDVRGKTSCSSAEKTRQKVKSPQAAIKEWWSYNEHCCSTTLSAQLSLTRQVIKRHIKLYMYMSSKYNNQGALTSCQFNCCIALVLWVYNSYSDMNMWNRTDNIAVAQGRFFSPMSHRGQERHT